MRVLGWDGAKARRHPGRPAPVVGATRTAADSARTPSAAADPAKAPGNFEQADALIEQLERELRTTREDLEKTIQDLEAANEELKSSNEELLSMNEELQSANEEMETSKEEIQAAHDALARSNSDLENLLASTRIATLFLDEKQRIVRFTPAMTSVFNLIPSDVGRPLGDITHRAVQMPPLSRDPLGDGRAQSESEIQTVEGHWYIRRVLPYRNHLGQEQGMVVTFTDVTALKAAQEALQESEQRFRQLAEAMPQLVWTTSPDGAVDYFNRRWFEYTGMPPEQALGKSWTQALHPEEHDATNEAWQKAVASGSRYESEIRLRAASGGYQWFLVRGVPVRDAESRVTRWFGTCTNIHSQKLGEEALKDADRQKNLFLAMLAHELRNPLAPILNALHLLKQHDIKDAFVQQKREMIERQIHQLKRLLDDLLDIARITRGRISIREDLVDLRACIDQAVEAVRYALEAKRHRLTIDVPHTAIYVKGDMTRLTQVFTNLLTNAVKFTREEGSIAVSAGVEADRVWVRVRDNGIGMSERTRLRCFDLFAQAEQSLDRSEGGLGIGLTLVQRLVDLHQGTVEARSDGPGRGSEFVVELPLSGEVPQQASAEPPPPAEPKESRLRIVVVDDNADAAETLAILLEMAKHEVHIAYDGPSGLKLVTRVRPDAVFLDIGLPRLDGYQVARELRRTAGLEKTALIALSGYGQEEDRRRARDAGFDHHLIKPVNADEFFRVLNEVILRPGAN